VTWSSSVPAVATVDQTGKATAVSPGQTTIAAKVGSVSGPAQLEVTPVPVARVVISPNTLKIDVGETRQLTARTYDAAGNELTGRVVTWSSSATSIATVDAAGNVKAIKKGDATITATSEGKSDSITVTVK
jgi:uncharacterized protein YjdB